jgi:hypothetical protein
MPGVEEEGHQLEGLPGYELVQAEEPVSWWPERSRAAAATG